MASYLVHFNPFHDKLGRFTFSKTTPEQKANYKYLKGDNKDTIWKRRDRAKELSEKFSKEYDKHVSDSIKNINSFKDFNEFEIKYLDNNPELDSEIDKLLGKYADKIMDKRMGTTYREVLKTADFNRIYNRIMNKLTDTKEVTDEKVKTFNKKHNLLPISYKKYNEDPVYKKRADDAAILGLKALQNTRYKNNPGEIEDPTDPSEIKWFLFEDQTSGYPTIADMVNRNYTKEKIINAIDEIEDIRVRTGEYEGWDYSVIKGARGLYQGENFVPGHIDEEFIDEAIKIKKES